MLQEVTNKLKQLIENKNMEANLVSGGKNSFRLGNSDEFKTILKNLNLAKPSRDEVVKYLDKLPDSQLYR